MSDKKPWEEEWAYDPSDPSEEYIIRSEERREVAAPSYGTTSADLSLISAAPDMARALLALHEAALGGSPSDIPRITEMARSALAKAGVLP